MARAWLAVLAVAMACGDGSGPDISVNPLTVGAPVADSIPRGGTRFYSAPVTPGALYRISVTDLTDDVDLYAFDDDGAFTAPVACFVDHSLLFDTLPEDCTAVASAATLYFAIDASDAAALTTRYTIGVELVPLTDLTLATPIEDTVGDGEARFYRAALTLGTPYSASITALTDSAMLFHVKQGDQGGTLSGTLSPKALRLNAFGPSIYLGVDGSVLDKPLGAYVVMVMQAPVLTLPIVPTEGAIPFRTPTVGWVETRSTSRYHIEDLPAAPYTVSILGPTGDIDLAVYSDATYSSQLDCTLQNAAAQECTVSGTALYFAVSAGPVNRDGAGYIILVW